MVLPGRDSPVKEARDTNPSTSPKWVFRPPIARRKLKRSATPHPGKGEANSKRDALVSLTETGRARKKIVFELEEPAAGAKDGTSGPAGVGEVSSPSNDRKGGRWTRKARPGPFEALHFATGEFEVDPGVLPLLPRDLHFSMGKKEALARDRADGSVDGSSDGAAGTGLVGTRPEEERPEKMNEAALVEPCSMLEVMDASLAAMDEDKLRNGDGANMLSESTICVAPIPEMPSYVLASETCDFLSQGKSNFEFKLNDDAATLPKYLNMAGEAEHDGKPPVPALVPENSPENSPEQDTSKQGNSKPQLVNPAMEEGNGGAAPIEKSPEPDSSPDPRAEPPGNVWNQPVKHPFGGNPENLSAGLVNGGTSNTDPVILDADHGKEMGTAGRCEGVPSLTFSNEETKCLADKMGHAIIGKFSHTIPTTQQIQKALSHVQFFDGFKWKFVNAKHILIQFRDARDYGRLLNGPNGAPVWYIEHHPMRVFKWTPDFDTFFESPIAVVWCRVIGLPIHLYDQSALIAIGKLLGKPIQADHATINQNRLAFARICIEIDISTPPPEEIILNILGKDTRYKVVWERIPLFCVECKHIGHVKEACLTLRKKGVQPTKEPSRPPYTHRANFSSESTRRAWRTKKPSADTHTPNPVREMAKEATEAGTSKEKSGADETTRMKAPMEVQIQVDEDGFQLVSKRRKGKPTYSLHQAQGGAQKANYLETLLKGSNVATVSFGKANVEVIDPGGSSFPRIK